MKKSKDSIRINGKEKRIEITITNAQGLFNLYLNPGEYFLKSEIVGEDSKVKTNNNEILKRIFFDYQDIEEHHQKYFDSDYYSTDLWSQFIFRGQSSTNWPLETSFYREYMRLGSEHKRLGGKDRNLFTVEKSMLREFQRNYKRFKDGIQLMDNEYYDWFAIMQHYGVPTRFLDFSYSFYVALFFASQNPSFLKETNYKTSFSIYAINSQKLEKLYREHLPGEIKWLFDKKDSIGKNAEIQKAIVDLQINDGYSIEPFRAIVFNNAYNLNTRLVHQKGNFLFPVDINYSFLDNLYPILEKDGKPLNEVVLKINVHLDFKNLIYLYKQLRHMNIGSETLFEDNLNAMGDVLKRKMFESTYSDVLVLNKQGTFH